MCTAALAAAAVVGVAAAVVGVAAAVVVEAVVAVALGPGVATLDRRTCEAGSEASVVHSDHDHHWIATVTPLPSTYTTLPQREGESCARSRG